MAWGFCKLNISRNDGVKKRFFEIFFKLFGNFFGKVVAHVYHGSHYSNNAVIGKVFVVEFCDGVYE